MSNQKRFSLLTSFGVATLTIGMVLYSYASIKSEVHDRNAAEIEASLGLINKKKVDVIIRIPSQQAYGFDGRASNPAQQAQVETVVDNLKQNANNLISLTGNEGLECEYEINNINPFIAQQEEYVVPHTSPRFEPNHHLKNSYWMLEIDMTYKCNKDLRNQNLNYDFSQQFKNVHKVLIDAQDRHFATSDVTGSLAL